MQKIPLNYFEWIKYASQLNEDFIKNYKEETDEGYLLEVNVQYLETLHGRDNDFPFLPETMKIAKVQRLVATILAKIFGTK